MLKQEDIQVVSICVPNYLHKEVAVAAAHAGKHAVCEKPLATTLKDADEMIGACKDNQVKLMYAEDWIFAPARYQGELFPGVNFRMPELAEIPN